MAILSSRVSICLWSLPLSSGYNTPAQIPGQLSFRHVGEGLLGSIDKGSGGAYQRKPFQKLDIARLDISAYHHGITHKDIVDMYPVDRCLPELFAFVFGELFIFALRAAISAA